MTIIKVGLVQKISKIIYNQLVLIKIFRKEIESMKKFLSLLSFLTISGATMPMVVAAAPYQINIQSEVRQLQRRIIALESEIEDKNLEEIDQRDNHEKYQKLYIETLDPGYLNYLQDCSKKIRFINKKRISLKNEKLALEEYLERLNNRLSS